MNKYRLKNELQSIATATKKSLDEELNKFGFRFAIRFNDHVADRMVDRSKNSERDLRNINFMMQQLRNNYICNILHHFMNDNKEVVLYKRYDLDHIRSFSLGTYFNKIKDKDGNDVFYIVIRTFIPEYELRLIKDRTSIEIKEPQKKIRLVSDLQKMLYSDTCPECLHLLR